MAELTGMQPVLAVENLPAELDYYVERLGFAVSWRWGDPPVRAGVVRDGLELQLVSDDRFAPSCPGRVYFTVRDVDAFYADCISRGADIDVELADRSFGMRDFRVVDRSGNILGFGETLSREEREDRDEPRR